MVDGFKSRSGTEQQYLLRDVTLEELGNHYDTSGQDDELDAVLDHALDAALETMEGHGLAFSDEPDVVYDPEKNGSGFEDRDGENTVEIGRPGRIEKEYQLLEGMTHELIHGHLRTEQGVEEYTPREEALTQVWNLYWAGSIEEEGERDEQLQQVQQAYNEEDAMPEGFGDDIRKHADRFLAMYDEDMVGSPTRKMTELLRTYEDRYVDDDRGLSFD